MHFLSASRIRVVIFLMVLVILWQIFRTWPDGPTYRVNLLSKDFDSFFYLNLKLKIYKH